LLALPATSTYRRWQSVAIPCVLLYPPRKRDTGTQVTSLCRGLMAVVMYDPSRSGQSPNNASSSLAYVRNHLGCKILSHFLFINKQEIVLVYHITKVDL
jgi:hypothetical protein